MEKTILVFYASRHPNAKNQYNWYEFKSVPILSAKVYSDIIGCRIVSLIPNIIASKSKFYAYADEEGLCSDNYARNDLAGGVLYTLGFRDSHILGMAYANTVIVTGNNGLTKEEQKILLGTINMFQKKL